jgi:hypothetical protein
MVGSAYVFCGASFEQVPRKSFATAGERGREEKCTIQNYQTERITCNYVDGSLKYLENVCAYCIHKFQASGSIGGAILQEWHSDAIRTHAICSADKQTQIKLMYYWHMLILYEYAMFC